MHVAPRGRPWHKIFAGHQSDAQRNAARRRQAVDPVRGRRRKEIA